MQRRNENFGNVIPGRFDETAAVFLRRTGKKADEPKAKEEPKPKGERS